jgi:hypothetical protein
MPDKVGHFLFSISVNSPSGERGGLETIPDAIAQSFRAPITTI